MLHTAQIGDRAAQPLFLLTQFADPALQIPRLLIKRLRPALRRIPRFLGFATGGLRRCFRLTRFLAVPTRLIARFGQLVQRTLRFPGCILGLLRLALRFDPPLIEPIDLFAQTRHFGLGPALALLDSQRTVVERRPFAAHEILPRAQTPLTLDMRHHDEDQRGQGEQSQQDRRLGRTPVRFLRFRRGPVR